MDGKGHTLWLPEQALNEFRRNRDKTLNTALEQSLKVSFNQTLPAFFSGYAETTEFDLSLKEANKRFAALKNVVNKHVAANTLEADKLAEELFLKATLIPSTSVTYSKGVERFFRGNPPGKNTTAGDEINWESLLSAVPKDQDLHLISGDGDYASDLDKNSPDPFLTLEWAAKGGKLLFYRSLSDFFAAHFPEIKLASELERQHAILRLAQSPSYYQTHIAIAALRRFIGQFSEAEALQLLEIANENSQVGGIAGDSDVASFYDEMLKASNVTWEEAQRFYELLPDDILTEPDVD